MSGAPARVLVAGGGVAGMEALLALRDLAGDRVDLSLLSPEADADVAAGVGARVLRGALAGVDRAARVAITVAGERLDYDVLLVAVGAHSEPALPRALTWTPDSDPELLGGLLRDIDEGYTKRVAFVVPPGVAWARSAYELALMTAAQAWDMGHDDVEMTVYTHEDAPLGLFGTRVTAALRQDLERAGITVRTRISVAEAPGTPRRLVLRPGDRTLDAQRVVALPRAAGPALAGLPADRHGFVLCDRHGRVPGGDGVWAAGDATVFPVKHGGLAAEQADAAAEAIAASVGIDIEPAPFRPVPRG